MKFRIREKKLLHRAHSLNIQKKGTNLAKYELLDNRGQNQKELNGKLGSLWCLSSAIQWDVLAGKSSLFLYLPKDRTKLQITGKLVQIPVSNVTS